ncbi:MAG: glycosyl transferase, partial [Pseudomonadota bacterium]
MHLIFASSIVPCGEPKNDFDIVNRAIVEAMQRAGTRVTFIGFKWSGTELEYPENTVCLGDIDPAVINESVFQKAKWLATAVKDRLTYASVKLRAMSDTDLEQALAAIEEADGVLLTGAALAGAYEETLSAKPYIYFAHNLEHSSSPVRSNETRGAFEKITDRREAKQVEKLERRLVAGARFTITLADEDRAV